MSNPVNRSHSRFIPQEEIDDKAVMPWRFDAVDAHAGALAPVTPAQFQSFSAAAFMPAKQLSADVVEMPEPQALVPAEPALAQEQLQQMLEQARAEGLAQGLAQGKAQTTQEWQRRLDDYVAGVGRDNVQRVDAVLQGLDAGFKQMQTGVASELLELACEIARQVVRQELRSQPLALLPVVREALDMLAAESRLATVRLNPADFAVLDEALRAEHGEHSKIQWLSDAAVAAGDVKVESGGAEIDAGLDKRWRRAVAALGLVSTWYDGAP
ncbi:FliH/SctL family protein [Comamonas sp. lk]|uniref:FliH/SctL family protein n=1 Tax=Comamonas sp. lk TaxID=2201272 RepID=UPI000EAC5A5E|nr:FliH/SctL family protein [Comamonas sp. lk]